MGREDWDLRPEHLRDISVSDKESSYEDRSLGGSHPGIVGHQNIFDAVFHDKEGLLAKLCLCCSI